MVPQVPDQIFLSTPSARRATPARPAESHDQRISIHALREEGDPRSSRNTPTSRPISIHALREEGDGRLQHPARPTVDFYPRPPRGGRRAAALDRPQQLQISIHALREEGDGGEDCHRDAAQQFLSTPSARRATPSMITSERTNEFLSTPSARRATRHLTLSRGSESYFYPRPPRGGRQPSLSEVSR